MCMPLICAWLLLEILRIIIIRTREMKNVSLIHGTGVNGVYCFLLAAAALRYHTAATSPAYQRI